MRMMGLAFVFLLPALLPAAPPPSDKKLLEAAANRGDTEAQFLLGLQYQDGHGVGRNEVQAAAWLLKAAESGHAEAAYALGELYAEAETAGLKDLAQAEKWLRLAAARGHQAAISRLGALQSRSGYRGPLPNPTMDAAAFQQGGIGSGAPTEGPARRTDSPESSLLAEDPAETIRWSLILSALRGPDAFVVRGYLLENGLAMNRDLESAAASYRRAAEAGHALAQYHLGLLYAEGRGVPRDAVEACVWLKRAHAAGINAAGEPLARVESKLTPQEQETVGQRMRDQFRRKPTPH